ncbi:MAG: hypothetical protein IJW00_04835 [Clostridia bacterium]|nr:hypothetical protein [Clostridia bacterium]
MKKTSKLICLSVLLLAVIACVTACGKWGDTYAALDGEGYTVSIRYDVGDGVFAGTNDVSVVDVYSLDDMKTNANGEKYTYLLTPDDAARGQSAFSVSNNGHFLAGWYQERTPRVNDKGEALDEYGQLCSVSGKAQGYVYAKPWDFDKPLTVDQNGQYSASENYMTLYAAWVPYFNFEFYTVDASGAATPLETVQAISLDLPEWNENTGKLDMKKFPKADGQTFESAYMDAALTEVAPETLTGTWDPATGTATTDTIKVYTTWMEGEWFRIYTAEQFKNNSRLGGNYILCADLDFSNTVWSPTLSNGVFAGKIIGSGHKISNVSVEQADISAYYGGIFGGLSETAEICDVTFENITYKIGAGSRMQGVSFGLLAGTVSEGATFKNVTVSGSLIVGANCYPGDYAVGLICGQGSAAGVDHSSVTASAEEGAAITVETNTENGVVTVTFGS